MDTSVAQIGFGLGVKYFSARTSASSGHRGTSSGMVNGNVRQPVLTFPLKTVVNFVSCLGNGIVRASRSPPPASACCTPEEANPSSGKPSLISSKFFRRTPTHTLQPMPLTFACFRSYPRSSSMWLNVRPCAGSSP